MQEQMKEQKQEELNDQKKKYEAMIEEIKRN